MVIGNREISRRGLLGGGIGLAATGAMSACSGGSASQGGSGADGPAQLRVLTWSSSEAHHSVFNAIAAEFIEANADEVSEITFDSIPLAEYPQTLVTQVSGGQAPDLAWALNANALEYVDEGVFADARGAFEADEDWDLGDIVEGALDVWSKDDGIYAYPFSNQPFGVWVNLELLEQAGQPHPRDLLSSGEWTIDKLVQMGGAVADATGQGGLQLDNWDQWVELATMWDGFGAQPWSDDGTQSLFGSAPMVSFFEWLQSSMFDRHGYIRPGETYDFIAGTAAFKIHLISTGGGLDNSFEWDYLPLPAGPETQANVINQAAIGALSQSKQPELATKFLAFFTNRANSAKLSGFFPQPRKSLLNVDVLTEAAPFLSSEQIEGTIIAPAQDARSLPTHVNYSSFTGEVKSAIESISQADADVATILEDLDATLQPMMSAD